MAGDILGCYNREGGATDIWWIEARILLSIPVLWKAIHNKE